MNQKAVKQSGFHEVLINLSKEPPEKVHRLLKCIIRKKHSISPSISSKDNSFSDKEPRRPAA